MNRFREKISLYEEIAAAYTAERRSKRSNIKGRKNITMKKMLSLMITLCMFLLMLPLQMAAADSAEDAAKGTTDAAA
jgi:Fe2+ transport system protein B